MQLAMFFWPSVELFDSNKIPNIFITVFIRKLQYKYAIARQQPLTPIDNRTHIVKKNEFTKLNSKTLTGTEISQTELVTVLMFPCMGKAI